MALPPAVYFLADWLQNLASFIRTHEKALANALQLRRQPGRNASSSSNSPRDSSFASTSSSLAAALSLGALKFTSHHIKPAKLTLTPHHLFYLLSRFEDLAIPVGPMGIRLENIHTQTLPSYVSFLNKPQRSSKSDRDSIHSVSSVRSIMSGMSAFWSSFGLGSKDSSTKSEKAKAAIEADLKYLYSAFTKIPCLRLAPDYRARLIRGYEEFPFDTAVPLHSFKNLSALEIIDIDFRSFFGWDRLSEQLRTLTVKRAKLRDPADLLTGIVLDDIDKRRRRLSKSQPSPVLGWNGTAGTAHSSTESPSLSASSISVPGSPVAIDAGFGTSASPQAVSMIRVKSDGPKLPSRRRADSNSPTRPMTTGASSSKQLHHPQQQQQQYQQTHYTRHRSSTTARIRRTGSGSSNSSENSGTHRTASSSNLAPGLLPPTKWRFLRHLGLPDNSLQSISTTSLLPVANTLQSLDLSSNRFTELPESIASLVALRALNLSNCLIDSLHSLSRNPLPAITALNLRENRLQSLAGIERLLSLERLDLRGNGLTDPMEIARLTCLPEIREIWVAGNPFVKTHPNYRVLIFNLFRRTPGYSQDLILDGSGPGYSERKLLVERVAEPGAAPIVRPVLISDDDDDSLVVKPSAHERDRADLIERPGRFTPDSGYDIGSSRRKKPHRRKIVDISAELPSFPPPSHDSRPSQMTTPAEKGAASNINTTNATNINQSRETNLTPVSVQPTTTTSDVLVKPFFNSPAEPGHRLLPSNNDHKNSSNGKDDDDGGSLVDPTSLSHPEPPSHRLNHPPLLLNSHVLSEAAFYPMVSASQRGAPSVLTFNGSGSGNGGVPDTELLRQQIEAFNQDVGTSWLSALNGASGWENSHSDLTLPPGPLAGVKSQPILSGHTLG